MKKMLMAALLMSAVVACAGDRLPKYTLYVNSEELVYGVMKRENPAGDANAVGDKHLRYRAYGLLQIRYLYLKDVNRIAGKDVQKVWGKKQLAMEDMKDPAKAKWAFHVYLWHYGENYRKITGKTPTVAIYARIHNGGPSGWKNKRTLAYAMAVIQNIEAMSRG